MRLSERGLGEAFLMLSVLFVSATILSFNNTLHQSLTYRTIALLTAAIAIGYAYLFQIRSSLIFGLLTFVLWWLDQATRWVEVEKVKPAPVVLGLALIVLLFYLAGRLHGGRRRIGSFSPLYIWLGLLIASLLLFFFSIRPGLHYLQDLTIGRSVFSSWKMTLSLAILVATFIATGSGGLYRHWITPIEAGICALFIILFAAITFLPVQEVFTAPSFRRSALTSVGVVWAILFNALLFLETLGFILIGYRNRDELLVNIGVLFIFIFVFVKYVDWFFKFMDKSVFFIGAGILLLVLGWFMERGRRYVLAGGRQNK